MNCNHARHWLAATKAFNRAPSHGGHVMRAKNAGFRRCPSENLWIGGPP
jgi:hypothetical protein